MQDTKLVRNVAIIGHGGCGKTSLAEALLFSAGKIKRLGKVDQGTAVMDYDDEEIIARTMVPMCTEMARCVEEKIVETPAEADMALIFGIGFPPFRGGVFRWMDSIGLQAFCDMADKYTELGKIYEPTPTQREMAAAGKKYYA